MEEGRPSHVDKGGKGRESRRHDNVSDEELLNRAKEATEFVLSNPNLLHILVGRFKKKLTSSDFIIDLNLEEVLTQSSNQNHYESDNGRLGGGMFRDVMVARLSHAYEDVFSSIVPPAKDSSTNNNEENATVVKPLWWEEASTKDKIMNMMWPLLQYVDIECNYRVRRAIRDLGTHESKNIVELLKNPHITSMSERLNPLCVDGFYNIIYKAVKSVEAILTVSGKEYSTRSLVSSELLAKGDEGGVETYEKIIFKDAYQSIWRVLKRNLKDDLPRVSLFKSLAFSTKWGGEVDTEVLDVLYRDIEDERDFFTQITCVMYYSIWVDFFYQCTNKNTKLTETMDEKPVFMTKNKGAWRDRDLLEHMTRSEDGTVGDMSRFFMGVSLSTASLVSWVDTVMNEEYEEKRKRKPESEKKKDESTAISAGLLQLMAFIKCASSKPLVCYGRPERDLSDYLPPQTALESRMVNEFLVGSLDEGERNYSTDEMMMMIYPMYEYSMPDPDSEYYYPLDDQAGKVPRRRRSSTEHASDHHHLEISVNPDSFSAMAMVFISCIVSDIAEWLVTSSLTEVEIDEGVDASPEFKRHCFLETNRIVVDHFFTALEGTEAVKLAYFTPPVMHAIDEAKAESDSFSQTDGGGDHRDDQFWEWRSEIKRYPIAQLHKGTPESEESRVADSSLLQIPNTMSNWTTYKKIIKSKYLDPIEDVCSHHRSKGSLTDEMMTAPVKLESRYRDPLLPIILERFERCCMYAAAFYSHVEAENGWRVLKGIIPLKKQIEKFQIDVHAVTEAEKKKENRWEVELVRSDSKDRLVLVLESEGSEGEGDGTGVDLEETLESPRSKKTYHNISKQLMGTSHEAFRKVALCSMLNEIYRAALGGDLAEEAKHAFIAVRSLYAVPREVVIDAMTHKINVHDAKIDYLIKREVEERRDKRTLPVFMVIPPFFGSSITIYINEENPVMDFKHKYIKDEISKIAWRIISRYWDDALMFQNLYVLLRKFYSIIGTPKDEHKVFDLSLNSKTYRKYLETVRSRLIFIDNVVEAGNGSLSYKRIRRVVERASIDKAKRRHHHYHHHESKDKIKRSDEEKRGDEDEDEEESMPSGMHSVDFDKDDEGRTIKLMFVKEKEARLKALFTNQEATTYMKEYYDHYKNLETMRGDTVNLINTMHYLLTTLMVDIRCNIPVYLAIKEYEAMNINTVIDPFEFAMAVSKRTDL